jgi:hypothetical protein
MLLALAPPAASASRALGSARKCAAALAAPRGGALCNGYHAVHRRAQKLSRGAPTFRAAVLAVQETQGATGSSEGVAVTFTLNRKASRVARLLLPSPPIPGPLAEDRAPVRGLPVRRRP